jgi:hypothetical protein
MFISDASFVSRISTATLAVKSIELYVWSFELAFRKVSSVLVVEKRVLRA